MILCSSVGHRAIGALEPNTKNKPVGRASEAPRPAGFHRCCQSARIGPTPSIARVDLEPQSGVGAGDGAGGGRLGRLLLGRLLGCRGLLLRRLLGGRLLGRRLLGALAPFFLGDFFAVVLAAFLFFAIASGSFRCSARVTFSWSIPQGADMRGETSSETKINDGRSTIAATCSSNAIVAQSVRLTIALTRGHCIEPSCRRARQGESEKNRRRDEFARG